MGTDQLQYQRRLSGFRQELVCTIAFPWPCFAKSFFPQYLNLYLNMFVLPVSCAEHSLPQIKLNGAVAVEDTQKPNHSQFVMDRRFIKQDISSGKLMIRILLHCSPIQKWGSCQEHHGTSQIPSEVFCCFGFFWKVHTCYKALFTAVILSLACLLFLLFCLPDFLPSLKNLFGNPVYILYLCASIIQFNSLIGMVTYKPKYIEQQYGQTSSKTNFVIGNAISAS